ncbi:MAG: amino acid adenylation domain-containing protein, partial [Acidobacteriota bacterium]
MAERAISELSPQKLDALIRRLKDRSAPAAPAPIARRPHGEAPLPLSFAQQRFWLLERLDPGSQAYHMPGSARLDGRLDRQALGRALAEIIHRHEVLRTTFREVDGQPVQGVAPTTPFSLPLIDLESLPTPARESEAARILDRLAATPFDLRAGPLLRVVLVRYGQRSHLLLQDQHHIVADGWSLEVFYRELESLYTAFVANESSPLPPLPLQYADFCLWQRQPPDSKVSDSQLDYWRERLAEPLPVLELPSDHPRPPIRTYTGERETRTVSGQLADELKALGASDKGTTLFMVLLAAFAALMSRQSGQTDLVIGTPVAGRDRRETEPLIGCFLNLLALRVDLSTRPPFRELLRRVRETALGAYSHQQIAFEQVLETVCPERTLDRTSLFQAFFNMPPPAGGQLELAELVIEPGPAPEGPSGFDLTLYARELAEGGLRFDLVYNADLFDRVRMGETLNQYLTLLAAIANDPEQPIDRYSLLTAGASECLPDPTAALAASWHGAIHERFAENAARAPERCAVVDAEHHWSYGELARQSRGIAAALRSGNVEPGAVVAIYACRSGSLVAALLGVLEAEAVFVVLDPDHPAARLREILHQAEPAALIELAEAGPPPAELETAIDALPTRITLDAAGASSAERGAGSASGRRRRPGDLAYIAFTSGSSGRPRGILGSHGPLSSFLHWYVDRFGHRPDDCFALLSGLSHDPLLRDVFAPLWLGARLEIPDGDQFGEPGWLSGWLARRRVSVVHTTPAMAQQMTSAPLQGVEAPRLSTLRWVFYGGDRLRWEDVARLRQTAPQANCVNFYGATETPQAVAYQIAAMASAAVPRSGPVPLGRGVAEAQLLVLTEAGDLATVGELGEIAVRSRHLALGYLDDEPLTRARFLDSPWGDDSATDELPHDRLYLTGDLGRFRPDGRVEFAGRADRQLKIRGFRIEPAEIEAALERQPGIARAVVIGQEVDENQRLLAYVVGRPRQDGLDSEALRADLGKELPSHMLPGAFVELEQMPLTPNGKVDYAALPAWDSGQLPPDSVAPRSPLEQAIASVWAELLKVEQVGTHQNFFALGGHSLLATRLIARLSSTLGVDLSLQTLFAQPTVSGLAAALEAELQAGRKPPPPLRRRPDRRAPLTFAQQRLWFLDQLEPGNPAYNMPLALDVRGDLDLAALYSCLVALAERQEALKTRFVELTDGPEQRFEPGLQPPLIEIDLGGLPKVRRQDAAHQLCRLLTRRPFDLGHGPLLVAYALRLDPEHHLLLLVSHHIISDGWSSGILVRELAALYQASRDHRTATLSMLPVRYGDYAHWQRGWLQGTVLEAQLDFWRRQLAGAPTTLELPSDRPRPSVLSFRGEELRFELGLELTERLESMSRSRAVTLYMTLLALFETWLGRLSGQGDLLIGTPIANRNRSELEGLIGLFANSLVLRGDLTGDPNFAELLGRVRRRALAAYSHQDLPFEKLVEALQPERDLARNPLFQVMFALQNAPLEAVALPDLTLAPVATGSSTSRFDLTLNLTATGNGLAGRLEYSSELFDRTTIQRWLGNLRDLADGAARHPDRRLSQLPWLPPAERHQLLVEWQRTASEALPTTPVFRWIERQAAATPDASALVFRQGVWSYRELNGRANRLARFLCRLGIGPGTLVGLGLERSPELVVAALGIQKAGGAYLPLDPGYPPERLALMLADSRAEVLVSRSGAHPEIGGETIRRVLIDADAGIDAESPEDLPGGAGLEDTAYVIYTSGSTGRPKGVVISHGALGNFLASMRDQPGLTLADRLLAVTSLSFDIATLELYLPLTVGATIWLADSTEVADGRRLAALIERAGANVLQATPSTWRMLLDAGWHGAPQLRALVGGEALARDLAAELVDRSQALWNLYGPTETTVWSALHRCAAADAVGEGSVVIGRPIANTAVALLDRRLQPVPMGAWGELAIGGDGVARGYLGRPQLTAEVFVPDALTGRPGRRLYRTGDLARVRSAGALEFLGRLDHQLKVRGFRIEPGEIEAALRQHAEVRDAAVVARRLSANAEPSLVGYVVPSSTLDHEALREHLRSLLPAYMVPSVFVALEALPLTPNAKLDRKALPEPAAHRQGLATAYVAPRDETERNLAAIWQEVLGVARVGVDDDFFSLGGHSLMATQLMSRLRERFRVDLPLRQLFETATIAGLAAEVSAAANQAADLALPPLEPEAPGEETPLSFAQERLWFLDKLEPGSTAYQISGLLNFAGPLDQAALERSFCALARRHEILRSSFPTRGGRGVQRLAEPRPVPMPVVDLTALAAEVRDEVARLLAAGQAARGFDLTRGPLLRLLLLRLEPQRHLALVVLHHIVADAWSLGLFAREIVALYDAFSSGRPNSLAGLPVQYADYARWQRRWLRDDLLDEQLDYWRQRLEGGRLPPIELPTDRPRPAIQSYRGGSCTCVLPKAQLEQLEAVGRANGATLFMTLLAALATLLHRYAGQADVVIGAPVAGRRHPHLESLIGLFVNTLPMRVSFAGSPRFASLLEAVRAGALGDYAHQDLPFEKLVEALQPERHLSRHPLFDVMLNLLNTPSTGSEPGELAIELEEPLANESKFSLTLTAQVAADELELRLVYQAALFSPQRAASILDQYKRLLSQIGAAPERSIDDYSLVGSEDRVWLPDPAAPLPAPKYSPVPQLVAEQAARRPDASAVTLAGHVYSYRELATRAEGLARQLVAGGLRRGETVAVCGEPSFGLIVAMCGVLASGGVLLLIDPQLPAPRRRRISAAADVACRIELSSANAETSAESEGTLAVDPLSGICDGPIDNTVDLPALTGEEAAYIFFTSGSSGRPKGVRGLHRGLSQFLDWQRQRFAISTSDRVAQLVSLSFDAVLRDVFLPLTNGATLCLPSTNAALQVVPWLANERVTVVHTLPAVLRSWLVHPAEGLSLSDLRWLFCSGEPLDGELVRRWRAAFPGAGSVVNLYGPTETTMTKTFFVAPPEPEPGVLPVGRAIDHAQALVLGPGDRLRGVNEAGEIVLRTPFGTAGYLDAAEGTQAFVPNPFRDDPADVLYRTGDRGRYRPDGELEILGRLDAQIKVRGVRIEPEEVETVLERHPDVAQAAVGARPDKSGVKRLIAWVVARRRFDALAGELRQAAAAELPPPLVPSEFVWVENLPLTATGKIDRRALPEPGAAEPAIRAALPVSPRSDLERKIAAIWQRTLEREEVGVHDNFFDLGGHSLRLVEVQSRLRHELGRELSMLELFQHPTIAALAGHLAADTEAIEQKSTRRSPTATADGRIAIVGFAGRFPGARDPELFWQNLRLGVESITAFSDEDLLTAGVLPEVLERPNYVRAGSVLDDVELFDAGFFGFNPREAQILDPQHRLLLECAWDALERAGYEPRQYDGRIGVFAGVHRSTYLLHLLADQEIVETVDDSRLKHATDKDYLATRVSYKLDLSGPSFTVQTTCSTSLVATHLACRSLLAGECEMALAGGVSVRLPQVQGYLRSTGGILSPDGHCRAFDARGQGTIFTNGLGLVVLKRLEDALADGDAVHAVILGTAINNDGGGKIGYTAPSIDGQSAVIRAAHEAAGVDPATISYVEAHGTATPL